MTKRATHGLCGLIWTQSSTILKVLEMRKMIKNVCFYTKMYIFAQSVHTRVRALFVQDFIKTRWFFLSNCDYLCQKWWKLVIFLRSECVKMIIIRICGSLGHLSRQTLITQIIIFFDQFQMSHNDEKWWRLVRIVIYDHSGPWSGLTRRVRRDHWDGQLEHVNTNLHYFDHLGPERRSSERSIKYYEITYIWVGLNV